MSLSLKLFYPQYIWVFSELLSVYIVLCWCMASYNIGGERGVVAQLNAHYFTGMVVWIGMESFCYMLIVTWTEQRQVTLQIRNNIPPPPGTIHFNLIPITIVPYLKSQPIRAFTQMNGVLIFNRIHRLDSEHIMLTHQTFHRFTNGSFVTTAHLTLPIDWFSHETTQIRQKSLPSIVQEKAACWDR